MARKKKPEEQGLGSPWMNTFADLMNLLLCFFVLLFSMSTVDAEKYEAIVTSMTNKVDIFPAGGDKMGDGVFVSSGTDQLVEISEYFAEFEESGNPTDSDALGEEDQQGNESPNAETVDEEAVIERYKQEQFEELKSRTESLLSEVESALSQQNLSDLVNVSMDENYQYVQLSIKGAILFDSGQADVKRGAVRILNRLGDLLKVYEDQMIEIIGHTDNVPISNGVYKSNSWLSSARASTVYDYLTDVEHINPENMKPSGRGEYEPVASNKTEAGRALNRRVEIRIHSMQ